ncbi:hypothetical protein FOMG_18530 [Fusarium oxysporum f. sp. melonis 26406]|uniref:Uncharacterized protein n=1 Tax=Fusarium oxysporum f. sp. melonis 26406 TaxID=1089452 RepID=W9Z920_FUSOX|nr:hypothetical protein FOMG_18530 [Fusarium oxysporum f. sp. melonis 26406]
MRKRLTSRILPLDLDLNRRLNVVAPVNAKEPIISGRAASGVVDGVRQFSNTTSLSILDQDAVPLNAQLQSVSNAISQGPIQQENISAAKCSYLSSKRPRRDSQDERDDGMAQIWAILAKIKERDTRMEALENDDRCLKESIKELVARLALLETRKGEDRRVGSQTMEKTAELVNIDLGHSRIVLTYTFVSI